MVVAGPIKGRATDAIRREISVFKDALAAVGGVEEAFICVYAPGWLDHFIYDEYYNNDEAFVFALAEAMREEYKAGSGNLHRTLSGGTKARSSPVRPSPACSPTTALRSAWTAKAPGATTCSSEALA